MSNGKSASADAGGKGGEGKNAADPADDVAGADDKENAGAADGGDGQQDDAADGADSQDSAGAGDIYKPEGMPEHYLGKDNQETIDKLLKANEGFRKQQAKSKGMPEKLDDYSIELPEELASKVLVKGKDGKDPIFEKMRERFFERGIPAEQALGIIEDFYGDVAAFAEEAVSGQQEKLEGAGYEESDAEYKALGGAEKAKPIKDAVTAWITGLKTQNVIDDADVKEMLLHVEYGQGLRWLEKIRQKTGGKPIPVKLDGKTAQDGKTKEELDKMMEDPKYWREKDPAFIQQVTEGYQALYGDKE